MTVTNTLTCWILIDRKTGNIVMTHKNETKVRAKCEMNNMKANREAFYVRPMAY